MKHAFFRPTWGHSNRFRTVKLQPGCGEGAQITTSFCEVLPGDHFPIYLYFSLIILVTAKIYAVLTLWLALCRPHRLSFEVGTVDKPCFTDEKPRYRETKKLNQSWGWNPVILSPELGFSTTSAFRCFHSWPNVTYSCCKVSQHPRHKIP